jgi:hypothetical protein
MTNANINKKPQCENIGGNPLSMKNEKQNYFLSVTFSQKSMTK